MSGPRMGPVTVEEMDFAAQKRAKGASWSSIATMMGRREPDLRAACDPAYRRAMRAPLAAPSEPRPTAVRDLALAAIKAELSRLHGRPVPTLVRTATALLDGATSASAISAAADLTHVHACARLAQLEKDGIAERGARHGRGAGYAWRLAAQFAPAARP